MTVKDTLDSEWDGMTQRERDIESECSAQPNLPVISRPLRGSLSSLKQPCSHWQHDTR